MNFANLELHAQLKNKLLSHERLPSDNADNVIRYELIDVVSTIALKWILVSRIKQAQNLCIAAQF